MTDTRLLSLSLRKTRGKGGRIAAGMRFDWRRLTNILTTASYPSDFVCLGTSFVSKPLLIEVSLYKLDIAVNERKITKNA